MKMRTYVISFIDFMDNLLDIQKIVADNSVEAMCGYLCARDNHWCDIPYSDMSVEEIRKYVSECDCAIAYIEV